MFKMAMVAVLTVALTGCVSYTNSKGEGMYHQLRPDRMGIHRAGGDERYRHE